MSFNTLAILGNERGDTIPYGALLDRDHPAPSNNFVNVLAKATDLIKESRGDEFKKAIGEYKNISTIESLTSKSKNELKGMMIAYELSKS